MEWISQVFLRVKSTDKLEVSKDCELIEGRCYIETSIRIFCMIELLEGLSDLNASRFIFLILTIYYPINFLRNDDFLSLQHSGYYGSNWIKTINQSPHYCFLRNFMPIMLTDMSNLIACPFNFGIFGGG